jgi:hypothetical protein
MIFPKRRAFSILIFCFGWSLAGCSDQEERLVEETVEQNFPVAPNARISIRNEDGAIRLYGSTNPDAKIQAIKKAYGRDRLKKISVNISRQANAITIDTTYPPRPKFSWSDRSGIVDYTIVVPDTCTVSRLELTNGEVLLAGMRGGEVSAKLVNGRLFDHNGFGKHDLFVANGSVDVIFDWWEHWAFSTNVRIVNGNARAFIPSKSSFHLVARTPGGGIGNDFGDQAQRRGDNIQKIDSDIGDSPKARIDLQATEGNIAIIEANP